MASNSFTKRYTANKAQSKEIRNALSRPTGTISVRPGHFTSAKDLATKLKK